MGTDPNDSLLKYSILKLGLGYGFVTNDTTKMISSQYSRVLIGLRQYTLYVYIIILCCNQKNTLGSTNDLYL